MSYRNDIDTFVPRRSARRTLTSAQLLNQRKVGDFGTFDPDSDDHRVYTVRVTKGATGKVVSIISPQNHETDGQMLTAEQIRRVDWN